MTTPGPVFRGSQLSRESIFVPMTTGGLGDSGPVSGYGICFRWNDGMGCGLWKGQAFRGARLTLRSGNSTV